VSVANCVHRSVTAQRRPVALAPVLHKVISGRLVQHRNLGPASISSSQHLRVNLSAQVCRGQIHEQHARAGPGYLTTETRSHSATENSDCRLIPRFGFSPRDMHAPPRNYLTSNPLVLRLCRTEGLPLQFSLGSASQRNEGTLFASSLGSTNSEYRERTFQCSEGRRNGNTEIILGIINGSTTLGGKPVEYAYGI